MKHGNKKWYLEQVFLSWKKVRMHLSVLVRRMDSGILPVEFEQKAKELMEFMDTHDRGVYVKYKKEKGADKK